MRSSRWLLILVLAASPLFGDVTVVQQRMLVTTDWLAGNLRHAIVLDVGHSRDAYDRGHIPGAIFLPLSQILVERDGVPAELPRPAELQAVFEQLGVGDTGRIVIYGDSELAAARAFFTLDYLGHGWRTSLLDGGFSKWRAENRAISLTVPAIHPRAFTPSVQRAVVVQGTEIARLLGFDDAPAPSSGPFVLIDARPTEYFTGQVPGVGIPRPGHIPSARNYCWTENLTGGAVRTMLSADQLDLTYRELGVRPGSRIITYCRTGMEASLTYFVLRYLGYEPALYDGSFIEWSNEFDVPVERSDIYVNPEIAGFGR